MENEEFLKRILIGLETLLFFEEKLIKEKILIKV